MNILLIGMTISGKNHTGKFLAEKLKYKLIDHDELAEKKLQEKDISTYDAYLEVAIEYSNKKNTILSSGGRFGMYKEVNELFKNIYFLDASEDLIVERTKKAQLNKELPENKRRQLVRNHSSEEDIRKMYQERHSKYITKTKKIFSYDSNEEQELVNKKILMDIKKSIKKRDRKLSLSY